MKGLFKRNALFVSLFLLLSICLITGCRKEEEVLDPETIEEEEEELEIIEEEPEIEVYTGPRSILTGLPIDEETALKRPIALMTENTKMCLPQYGLNSSGVIYECPMEGGYTRLMQVFDDVSGMEQLGNVRSTRPYFIWFANEYDAILVHVGQSVHAKALLDSGIINDLNGVMGEEQIVFYRTSEHNKPHNMYASAEGIDKGIDYKKFRREKNEDYPGHFNFADDNDEVLLSEGDPAVVIKPYFFYNKPWFIYDEELKKYKRYQFDGVQVDHADGDSAVTIDNIIFENVETKLYPNTEYVDVSMIGEGTGKYFTRGRMVDITWKKSDFDSITRYYDMAGNELKINQGRTWICLTEYKYLDQIKYYSSIEEYEEE